MFINMFINKKVSYKRRKDIEPLNGHILIIDIMQSPIIRLITLYRSFRPPDNVSPIDFFKSQLGVIENNCIPNTIILGDITIRLA